MFVLVVGGGKTGAQLAAQLIAEGHKVRVVESREIMLERLHAELPPEVIVAGDGSSPSVLEAAGIREANVLAAVTGEDDANLVVTSLGRFEFNVPRIIARVNNPGNAWLFTPEMGVDVAIDQTDLMAKLIAEEMSLGDMMTLLKLRKGEYAVVEEKVAPQAPAAGKGIKDINLPDACTLVAVIRKGTLIVPRGDVVLQPMDEVIALIHSSQVPELAALLSPLDRGKNTT
jgi:trk system potassium uptake protein TrkA